MYSVIKLILVVILISTGQSMASSDLDRWQLHEMAAIAFERDPSFFKESSAPATRSTPPPQLDAGGAVPTKSVSTPSVASQSKSLKKKFSRSTWKKEATVDCLRQEAHELASRGLVYQFGSDDPSNGGLDCSATVQYLLSSLGIKGVPRTSYLQYEWLKKSGTLHEVKGKNSTRKLLRRLTPGDLIFWGGTWKSGHKVSHVMIYLGYNPNNRQHYVFGARGKRTSGLTGAGVDVFVLNPDRGSLVGHGRVPGLRT